MKNNIINVYMDYKVSRLVELGMIFFHEDSDEKFIRSSLEKYIRAYIDFYYYGIFNTIEGNSHDLMSDLRKELNGFLLEQLDEYAVYELVVSNEEYQYHIQLIHKAMEVTVFLSIFDQLRFSSKDEISTAVKDIFHKYPEIFHSVGSYENQIISIIKDTYQTEIKFFKKEDEYFELNSVKLSMDEPFYYLSLKSQIKILEVHYKPVLVDRVYRDEKLNKDKCEILIQKISKELLRKILNQEEIGTYFLPLDDNLFYRGKLLVEDLLDHPLLKRYLILVVSFSTYHKNSFIKNSGYRYACSQDLFYIHDVYDKIQSIDKENFFQYIIITNYKEKDKKEIDQYQCSSSKGLFVHREG